jgi:hypothetical protein
LNSRRIDKNHNHFAREAGWLKTKDDIFKKLALVDMGFATGSSFQELASIGIIEHKNVF